MKIDKFRGLNNVLPANDQHDLQPGDLREAVNVDVYNDGALASRAGFVQSAAGSYANVWEGSSLGLATLGENLIDLATGAVLHAGAGTARMDYCELPDGRVIYANGTANGMLAADASTRLPWGVPVPAAIGVAADTAGQLAPGDYRWCLTHRRDAGGLEGGPIYSAPVAIDSGIALTALPMLAGHSTRVYITALNGSEHYLAGNAVAGAFTLTSAASRAVKCMTHHCKAPMPDGLMPSFWRGRMLLAAGDVLYASKARTLHLFNVREDFRRLAGTITMIAPVDNGIWVGTTAGLFFLGTGDRFDQLKLSVRAQGAVLRGSAVRVPGESLMHGSSVAGKGNDGIVCIADRRITACYADGSCTPITEGRYLVASGVDEVCATFRRTGATSQYIAVPM